MNFISANLIGTSFLRRIQLVKPREGTDGIRTLRTTKHSSWTQHSLLSSSGQPQNKNLISSISSYTYLIKTAAPRQTFETQKRYYGSYKSNPQQTLRHITSPATKLRKESNRSMFIRTEVTPNPDSLKFFPDRSLLEPGQSVDFPDAMSAARSPLAKKLFRNEQVKRVFLGSSFVTITKDEEFEWENVKPVVFADLMEFFSTDEPILLDEVPASDTTILPDDSEEVAMIKELLETRIRPSVQDDGGDITYKGFIDGVVFLKLQGSCSSCPSSSVTLKNGIERMLMHWISEVQGVVAVESDEEFERLTEQSKASSAAKKDAPNTTEEPPQPAKASGTTRYTENEL